MSGWNKWQQTSGSTISWAYIDEHGSMRLIVDDNWDGGTPGPDKWGVWVNDTRGWRPLPKGISDIEEAKAAALVLWRMS